MKKKLSSSTYGTVEEEKEDFFASSSTVDVESLQRRRRDDDDVIIGETVGVKPSKNGMMRAKTIALACGACAVIFAVSASVMKGGGSGFVASSSKSPSSSDGAFSLGGL